MSADHELTPEEVNAALESASDQLTDEGSKALQDVEEAEASGDTTKAAEARERLSEIVKAIQIVDQAIAKNKNDAARCPPGTPECGPNDCTAMSEAARQTMRCIEQALQPGDATDPFYDPVFDPSPLDDSTSPAWVDCFESISEEGSAANKQCWAYDCGPEWATITLEDGRCGCGGLEAVEGGVGMSGTCGSLQCPPDSNAVFQGGRCSCVPAGGWGGEGPSPPPPFVLGTPARFTDARRVDERTTLVPDNGGFGALPVTVNLSP